MVVHEMLVMKMKEDGIKLTAKAQTEFYTFKSKGAKVMLVWEILRAEKLEDLPVGMTHQCSWRESFTLWMSTVGNTKRISIRGSPSWQATSAELTYPPSRRG